MTFGPYEKNGFELLREQLIKLLDMVRGGTADLSKGKIPFSMFLPDFGVNQAVLTEEHTTTLASLASTVLVDPALEIDFIVGRASQTGNEANNESLSQARAEAVQQELDALAIRPTPPASGFGSTSPVIDLPNQEVELNRSVEIRLWFDLSYHTLAATDLGHPSRFWAGLNLGDRYSRPAIIVQMVYDNIDTLYSPIYATGVDAMNVVTIGKDDALVRSRALLGYYKQTGSSSQAILGDVDAFNALLENAGLGISNFTGTEISDAEHYVTGAVFGMIPAVGLGIGSVFSFYWEAGQSAWGFYKTGSTDSLKYNMEQLTGADLAGVLYGAAMVESDD